MSTLICFNKSSRTATAISSLPELLSNYFRNTLINLYIILPKQLGKLVRLLLDTFKYNKFVILSKSSGKYFNLLSIFYQ